MRLSWPWFSPHRSWATAVAVALFAGIFAVRLTAGDSGDPMSLFYALPVALLAMTWGLRGGAVGSLAAVALVVGWVVLDDVELSAVGWSSRIVPLALLGLLVGSATDGLERARVTEQELLATQLREREAAEINDSIIQGLVAAKWLIESGESERGVAFLSESIQRTQDLVGDLLRDRPVTPGMFRRRTEVQPFEPGRR